MPEFHSFLSLIIIPLSIYATFCLFSHWWARGLLPPLWPLWKTDVMHTDVQAALQLACFQFFGVYIPKSRIGRLYGNSIFNFWVTVFYSNCTILHSHQQYTRVPISLHLCPHIILFFFLNNCHPNRCEVVSHCVFYLHFSNDFSDTEHLFHVHWLFEYLLWRNVSIQVKVYTIYHIWRAIFFTQSFNLNTNFI